MITQEQYTFAFADAYWRARDDGFTSEASMELADEATQPLLDELEEA